jgi:hypothetical protein
MRLQRNERCCTMIVRQADGEVHRRGRAARGERVGRERCYRHALCITYCNILKAIWFKFSNTRAFACWGAARVLGATEMGGSRPVKDVCISCGSPPASSQAPCALLHPHALSSLHPQPLPLPQQPLLPHARSSSHRVLAPLISAHLINSLL